MKIIPIFAVSLPLLAICPAQAEIYKWIDSEGAMHFTDSEPANPAAVQQFEVREEKVSPAETLTGDPLSPQPETAPAPPQVDLYVTSWCPYCKKAIAFLRSNNIPFRAYDIEQDYAAAARKKQLDPGYSGIPLAIINGDKIRGFDLETYEAALLK